MSGKNPYTLALARQLTEIPFELLHHLRASRPLARAEKHRFGPAWRQYLLLWLPPADVPERQSAVVARAANALAMGDFALIPLYHQVAAWAMKRQIDYAPRTDEFTLAQHFRPAR